MTKNFDGRLKTLNDKIDQRLGHITGTNIPYTDNFTSEDYISLKNSLADIHNVLTLKLSLKFIDTLQKAFDFSDEIRNEYKNALDNISPNSKGFDIKLSQPTNVLAEIKCITPTNKNKFNAAQKKNLFLDAYKLKYKKTDFNQADYYKFLVVLDFGEATNSSIEAILKYKSTKLNEERNNRMQVVRDIIFLKDKFTLANLDKDKVYIVKQKL